MIVVLYDFPYETEIRPPQKLRIETRDHFLKYARFDLMINPL